MSFHRLRLTTKHAPNPCLNGLAFARTRDGRNVVSVKAVSHPSGEIRGRPVSKSLSFESGFLGIDVVLEGLPLAVQAVNVPFHDVTDRDDGEQQPLRIHHGNVPHPLVGHGLHEF